MSDAISRKRVQEREDLQGINQTSTGGISDSDIGGLRRIIEQCQQHIIQLRDELEKEKAHKHPQPETPKTPIQTQQENVIKYSSVEKKIDLKYASTAMPLHYENTAGTSNKISTEGHRHLCVSFAVVTASQLPYTLPNNVPALAYVQQEDRYYQWRSGSWVAFGAASWTRYTGR